MTTAHESRRGGLLLALPMVFGAIATISAPAQADTEQCIAASDRGATLRQRGKLVESKKEYLACSAESCPKIVREGCADLVRQLTADTPPSAPTTPGAPALRPTPPLAIVFGGVGIVALGSFVFFGLQGKNTESELEDGCAPYCKQEDADAMRQSYLAADISLGIAVVSLGVATVLVLTRPTSGAPSKSSRGPVAFARGGLGFTFAR